MSTQPLLQRTAGKRIALPVRVEPKVFFASESLVLDHSVGLADVGSRHSLSQTSALVSSKYWTEKTHTHLTCTVLSWLNFTVTLSALAAGLLNFGDNIGRISAAMFSFVGKIQACGRMNLTDKTKPWQSWSMH